MLRTRIPFVQRCQSVSGTVNVKVDSWLKLTSKNSIYLMVKGHGSTFGLKQGMQMNITRSAIEPLSSLPSPPIWSRLHAKFLQ